METGDKNPGDAQPYQFSGSFGGNRNNKANFSFGIGSTFYRNNIQGDVLRTHTFDGIVLYQFEDKSTFYSGQTTAGTDIAQFKGSTSISIPHLNFSANYKLGSNQSIEAGLNIAKGTTLDAEAAILENPDVNNPERLLGKPGYNYRIFDYEASKTFGNIHYPNSAKGNQVVHDVKKESFEKAMSGYDQLKALTPDATMYLGFRHNQPLVTAGNGINAENRLSADFAAGINVSHYSNNTFSAAPALRLGLVHENNHLKIYGGVSLTGNMIQKPVTSDSRQDLYFNLASETVFRTEESINSKMSQTQKYIDKGAAYFKAHPTNADVSVPVDYNYRGFEVANELTPTFTDKAKTFGLQLTGFGGVSYKADNGIELSFTGSYTSGARNGIMTSENTIQGRPAAEVNLPVAGENTVIYRENTSNKLTGEFKASVPLTIFENNPLKCFHK